MKTLYFIIICITLFSCSFDKRVDRSTYEEELKNREIKKVSEAQLFEKAIEVGNELALQSQKALGSKLQNAIKTGGISEAIQFCNINAYPIIDSLQISNNAIIKRVSLKYRNPKDKPDSLEQSLLEAYQYNLDNDLTIGQNIQDPHDGESLIFTKPILIDNPLCLQCHGELGKELKPETSQIVSEIYPEDLATNYKMNELRGMWSIKLSKKNLILKEF